MAISQAERIKRLQEAERLRKERERTGITPEGQGFKFVEGTKAQPTTPSKSTATAPKTVQNTPQVVNTPTASKTASKQTYDYEVLSKSSPQTITIQTPFEEAIAIEDPYKRQKALAEYYGEEYGVAIDPEAFPESAEEEFLENIKNLELDKSRLDREIERQKAEAERQYKQTTDAAIAQSAQGREGVVSSARQKLPGAISEDARRRLTSLSASLTRQQTQLDRLVDDKRRGLVVGRDEEIMYLQSQIEQTKLDMMQLNREYEQETRETLLKAIQFAQEVGSLGQLTDEDIALYETYLPEFSGVLRGAVKNARSEALTDYGKEQIDNLNNFKNLISDGVVFSPDSLIYMSRSTGIPLQSLLDINNRAEEIRADKKLDTYQKMTELEKLSFELDQAQRGITTTEAKKLEYIKEEISALIQAGASQAEVDQHLEELMANMGMDSMRNPKYLAELRIKRAEAQIKEFEAEGIITPGTKEYYEIQKLQVGINQDMAELKNYMTYDAYRQELELSIQEAEVYIKQKEANGEPVTIADRLEVIELNKELQKLGKQTAYVYTNSKNNIKSEVLNGELSITVPKGTKYQCGAFVNRVWGLSSGASGGFGDSYESKKAVVNNRGIKAEDITNPFTQIKPGMAFVMPVGGAYSKIGHVGIVKSINADGTFNTIEYNFDLKKSMSENVRPINQMYGFVAPPADKAVQIPINQQLQQEEPIFETAKQKLDFVTGLRKEWGGQAKESKSVIRAIQLSKSAYKDYERRIAKGEPVGDAVAAMIVTFNKILDPGSVVREGEFARTAEGQSTIQGIQGALEGITSGNLGVVQSTLAGMQTLVTDFEKTYQDYLINEAAPILRQADLGKLTEDELNAIFDPDIYALIKQDQKIERYSGYVEDKAFFESINGLGDEFDSIWTNL